MTASDTNTITGGVAIGRNEGERLRVCLRSLVRDFDHVVYVDSGSTDESLSIARELGVDVVELDTSAGFTAARARNHGLDRLLELAPGLELVQFVDGDCELVGGWTACSAEFLHGHPEVAVACGRRRERYPRRNWYHRITDMEWDTPVGETTSCGGDALMRAAALRQVGGYRDTMIAGEEPELCVRLRKAGWKVWRLERDMTVHDIRMSSFGQWWKRAVRCGHAYAEGAALHGAPPERHCVRQYRSTWFWGAVLPLICVAAAWPTRGLSVLVLFAAYALLLLKIARYQMAVRHDGLASALAYALSCVLGKCPEAIGQAKYTIARLTGTRPRIIEYDQLASTKPNLSVKPSR